MSSRALLVVLLLACGSAAPRARESWSAAEARSIAVTTNASAATAARVFAEVSMTQAMLEQATGSHRSKPLHVFALQDARSFASVSSGQRKREDLQVNGLSLTGPHDAFIALRTDRADALVRATLRHEYVHVLAAAVAPDAPAWLDEGLAEFWSAVEIEGDRLIVGRADQNHLEQLHRHKWLPLDAVLKQPRGSLPKDPGNVAMFYAQSWAMVHYLLMTGLPHGPPPFLPPAGALPQGFEERLHEYVMSGLRREVSVPWTPRAPETPTPRAMSEARGVAELANMLVSDRDPEAGLAMARRALTFDAREPLALAVVGMYYFRSNQPDQAREWLTRALDTDAESYSAALYMSLLSTSTADRTRYLVAALRARPDSELAWELLGSTLCADFSRNWLWFGGLPCA